MLEYNIFPGIAREGELVAAAVYFPEDYPGGIGEYKDYLLERDAFIRDLVCSDAVRVFELPFSQDRFEGWLGSNPCWKNARDITAAHSAWALDTVKDPVELADVTSERPYLPSPPHGEEIGVLVLYGVVPTVSDAYAATGPADARLPEELTSLVLAEFRRLFSACPPFRRLSRLRCSGLRVCVGDHFVDPDAAGEFEAYACSGAVRDPGGPVLHVPCHLRAGTGGDTLFTFSLLPVVLVGSGTDLDYCEGLVRRSAGFDSREVDRAVRELVRRPGLVTDGPVPFLPLEEALCLIEQALADVTAGVPGDCGHGRPAEKRRKRPRELPPYLRRVK